MVNRTLASYLSLMQECLTPYRLTNKTSSQIQKLPKIYCEPRIANPCSPESSQQVGFLIGLSFLIIPLTEPLAPSFSVLHEPSLELRMRVVQHSKAFQPKAHHSASALRTALFPWFVDGNWTNPIGFSNLQPAVFAVRFHLLRESRFVWERVRAEWFSIIVCCICYQSH